MSDPAIYVDLGAHEGVSIDRWLLEHPQSRVLGFEANPALAQRLQERYAGNERVSIVAAAAGTAAGESVLYPGVQSSQSSTLVAGKSRKHRFSVDYGHGVPVPVVDAAQAIREFWGPCSGAVIKINIEAAEYELVPHLIAAGVMQRFDAAWIEWHWKKFNIPKAVHDRVAAALAGATRVIEWEG
jgi:FkbM family methyltransferase